jgi:four helix bundle protein
VSSSQFRVPTSEFTLPPTDLQERTKAFALRIIRLYTALPKTTEAQVIGKQILRSGTSVGAHYREAKRARSDAEFISKLEGGTQELEETTYWLELLIGAEILSEQRLKPLIEEADELMRIIISALKTKKKNTGRSVKSKCEV